MIMRNLGLGLIFSLSLSAGSVLAADMNSDAMNGSMTRDVRGYEIPDQDLLKVSFAPGSAALTADERNSLAVFGAHARQQGALDRFIVAAWSDTDLPQGKELPRSDQRLASQRSKVIADILKTDGAKTVDRFEMTKQPNWLQRVFNTEGAAIKGRGSDNTARDKMNQEIGERLRAKGGPSSAVVVARFKGGVPVAH